MTQGSQVDGSDGRNCKMNFVKMNLEPLRETIHSGHFMVSDFEPESEVLDDEYEAGMPIPSGPEDGSMVQTVQNTSGNLPGSGVASPQSPFAPIMTIQKHPQIIENSRWPGSVYNTSISIDGSLTKLFQCMSLAYRQKLTSPKWNRFKGVRLRWKDKIRLNNVIWRCWHMQFILKQKTLVCQFASPLDVDQHNKPEAVVMEGKYWKRKLSTVAAEYKKWRLFYRNKIMGWTLKDPTPDLHPVSLDGFDWNRQVPFGSGPISSLIFDDDFLMDFSDTLFSSLSSNQLAFPNPRELARAGMVADFIQPGLIQLQPNLEDFMDTLEPLQDYVNSKLLPPVPEELENMEPPDSLLTAEVLPTFPLKTEATSPVPASTKGSSNSLQNNSTIQSGFSENSSQGSVYYQMPEIDHPIRERDRRSTVNVTNNVPQTLASSSTVINSAPSTSSVLKENHHSSIGSSRASSGISKNNIFAVPKGKPRGRVRNSASGRQSLTAPQTASCPPQSSALSHQSMLPTPMAHPQMVNTSINSNTLLSHLLTNSGASMDTKPPGSQVNNLGVGGNQILGSNGNSSNMLTPTGHSNKEIQQMQNQPWNPKNANETLPVNTPINFITKPLIPNFNQSMGVGGVISSGGNVSPPLLTNTPSPPHMGPPGGPGSPSKPFRPKSDTERVYNEEHRRVCHINAEQKRRCNIKNGFDMLHSLIPQLSHNPNAKVSKAAMLQKGAEYIRQLKLERAQLKEEIEAHRQEVDALNSAINNCQSMLPATGAPVSRQRTNKMKEMFDQWVRIRTTDNWRFWIFSILIRPLLDSYNNTVSTASVDELCRTVLAWVDQHCSLVDLRPAVLNSLRYLCTTTDILTSPGNLPEEAYKAVNRTEQSDRESR